MRAFVIRAFGQQAGVDFERVHTELIAPALHQAGVDGGGTTGEIVQAGNIREDMFLELYRADIVLADVSVHNANVFYELGIRHAARPRSTVLIYAKIDEIPFDLRTDRYLRYDPDSPGASLADLVQALRESLASEHVDSPVMRLLPGVTPGPHTSLLDLPRALAEDIEQAREDRQAGDLRLIADEVLGLRFEEGALRAVAQASEYVGDDAGAQRAWERIREVYPDDLQANRALANIYRRIPDLIRSDQALRRALDGRALTDADRAELYAGLGSNSKRRWVEQWRGASEQDRARVALLSQDREESFDFYRHGFGEDLNHLYSGLNALAMAKVTMELAARRPDDWRNRFGTDAEAERELERVTSEVVWLTSTVRGSIDSARSRSRRAGDVNFWIEVSAADLRFLTSSEPERVISAYQAAMSPRLSPGDRRSIREQVEIYQDLGILVENAAGVLKLFGKAPVEHRPKIHPLVFSGHMFDAPDRVHPRFPADQATTAREQIKDAIRKIAAAAAARKEKIIGMAGAADGGDLLFHEACDDLGIDTEVYLPVPELTYGAMTTSGQPGWAERYYGVLGKVKDKNEKGVHTLARTDALPAWLQGKRDYSIWQRNNQWILQHAWATTTVDRVTVLALWDGEADDVPGGVADMVAAAQAHEANVVMPGAGKAFGRPGPQPAQQSLAGHAEPAGPAVTEQDGQGEDRVLNAVWLGHRQWSKAASTAQKNLSRWRSWNLVLLVLGAVAAAFAAQSWLVPGAVAALAAVSAFLLAAAGFIQGTMLTADNTSRWTDARAASEALKAETHRYLIGVKPYAGPDRAERLRAQLDTIQGRAQRLLVDQQLADVEADDLPTVDTFELYIEKRAQEQATWHMEKARQRQGQARRLRFFQLAATAAGALLAAVAGALPGAHLVAWTAAATTIAAAFATHLAATQYQRLATSYAATVDQLQRLIVGVNPKTASADQRTQFVAEVERVLAAQNEGWVDLFSTVAKT
jgi:SMODS and SLOG-associating 2TM effector domain 1/Protein of unknown function (DUF4231)